jgi:P4 family phage/plasmid primase-like protien
MTTIELLTGLTREPRPEDYCTKCAGTEPNRDCPIPIWRRFLDEVTAGDKELQAYLQRVAGYCLIGAATEHVVFFFYGTGANGKGVFIDTLSGIWGDYAVVAPMETFAATAFSQHPTDLAGLRGARLVTAQETEKGQQWAESKIKMMTGGGPITARFMRQNFFTYVRQFKLIIAGNHKPSLTGVDEAIRRRIHLVPFLVTIAPEKRDKNLFEKLKPEWPGILCWAVDGCLEWQRIGGLAPPKAVLEATEEYLTAEDSFRQWIDECCLVGKDQWGLGNPLWVSWKAWAELNNERTGSRKAFAQTMGAHGHKPDKNQEMRGYESIDLKPRNDEDERERADLQ